MSTQRSSACGTCSAGRRPASLPFLNRQVGGLVRFCLLTGARMGEAVQSATRHVDTSGEIWAFRPPRFKTRHKRKSRVIYVGRAAQEVLRPFVQLDPDRLWFRPVDAMQEHRAVRRKNRKTPLWASHRKSQERNRRAVPRKSPGQSYSTLAVAHAIRAACQKAGINPAWSPRSDTRR